MANNTKIREEATWRGIQCLLHFTQFENLPGIVTHGFLSRADLEERGLHAYGSSRDRLDRNDQVVSLSVSAAYQKMFIAKKRASRNPRWVFLLLDSSILWTHRCRFLFGNAGTREITRHRRYLGGPWGFSRMFAGDDRSPGLSRHLPTNADAEVQVFDPIPPDRILGALVDVPDIAEAVQAELDRLTGAERDVCICRSWPIFHPGRLP